MNIEDPSGIVGIIISGQILPTAEYTADVTLGTDCAQIEFSKLNSIRLVVGSISVCRAYLYSIYVYI